MVRRSSRCDWLAIWILGSVWAQVAGWALSTVGHLDRWGYLLAASVFGGGLIACHGHLMELSARPMFMARRSTYARWYPRIWLVIALLAVIGGLLYQPDNFDYLTYRFPRVLHWWWDGHWSWLTTAEDRQNSSAVGIEWLMTPLLVFFKTDRLFFLINFISYVFLPGLTFSVLRRAGVGGRVAWSWMWLLPAGLCFFMQAASMGNDTFAAVYFLAALHYGFRAGKGSTWALSLSILSIALLTGAKASNIPLVLPWLAVLWQQRGGVLAAIRPGALAMSVVLAAVASFLPLALVNIAHTGSYTGDPNNKRMLQVSNPGYGVLGNSAEILLANLAPPLWPHPFHWPGESRITEMVRHSYPRFALGSQPFEIEEDAGIGPGLSALLILGVLSGARRLAHFPRRARRPALVLGSSVAVAWLGYMAKMGSEAAPRLVAVYYVALLLGLLVVVPPDFRLVRSWAWRLVGGLSLAVAVFMITLNPTRPVLPVAWIDAGLHALQVPRPAIERLDTAYAFRAIRADELHDLRQAIPASATAVGMVGGDDEPEVSLWIPFGSRRVIDLDPEKDDPATHGLQYVAVSGQRLTRLKLPLQDVLKKWSMHVVAQQPLHYSLRRAPETWYLLRAND